MAKSLFALYLIFSPFFIHAQQVQRSLAAAISELEKDKQFSHAIIGMYVAETKTGKVVYEKNSEVGLAPASCQKLITSASAFELLGKDYKYSTGFKIYKADDSTHLYIDAAGDPTLGSWRWASTKMDIVYKNLYMALKKRNINLLSHVISIPADKITYQPVPGGWVWEDIGNYYGAGIHVFNWHENQYDLVLSSGNAEGDPTNIKSFDPPSATIQLSNLITTGKKGSGDNAYIYVAPYSNSGFATGTIPPAQSKFVISGSIPDPPVVFVKGLSDYLDENKISMSGTGEYNNASSKVARENIYTHVSPPLDSINYWFMKKSVNLFGEAFVKTIALEKAGIGSTEKGVELIKAFWSKQGIESSALNIIDGSGLSPANRVTTKALVSILQFAKVQSWFPSFYNALPEMNGIKMKDGYIGGVRSYTGFIKSRCGIEYTFSFIANNFEGNPGAVREKMWKVLDVLK